MPKSIELQNPEPFLVTFRETALEFTKEVVSTFENEDTILDVSDIRRIKRYKSALNDERLMSLDIYPIIVNKLFNTKLFYPYFVEAEYTLADVGYLLGVTRERARQLQASAGASTSSKAGKFKHPKIKRILYDYVRD
ncbi:DNA binding protein [Thiohalocapsa phage LS06-2018-MD03]|nr:DNA binding protein [Thiohalocapsa phage LS06-2018-MD03]